jgi:hypothetical protein
MGKTKVSLWRQRESEVGTYNTGLWQCAHQPLHFRNFLEKVFGIRQYSIQYTSATTQKYQENVDLQHKTKIDQKTSIPKQCSSLFWRKSQPGIIYNSKDKNILVENKILGLFRTNEGEVPHFITNLYPIL